MTPNFSLQNSLLLLCHLVNVVKPPLSFTLQKNIRIPVLDLDHKYGILNKAKYITYDERLFWIVQLPVKEFGRQTEQTKQSIMFEF